MPLMMSMLESSIKLTMANTYIFFDMYKKNHCTRGRKNMSDPAGSYKDFLEKGKAAMQVQKYQEAISNFTIARKFITDLKETEIDQKIVEELDSLAVKAKEELQANDQEKRERSASLLSQLREKGETTIKKADTSPKAKKLKTVSIFLFGLDAAGKTTFVDYVKQEKFLDHAPTLGVNISRIALGNVQFVFNDVGGQEAYRANWQNYWKSPDFVIFTVDATDAARFDKAKDYLWTIMNSPDSAGLPLIVLSSKNDLPGAKPIAEIVQALELGNITDRVVGIFDISVKEGQNVERPLNFIASCVLTDAAMRKFVDDEISRLSRNYEEMYKAYIEEAKVLEKEAKFEKVINRVTKAKLIQEELFKQGYSKAHKEILKCDEWLSKYRDEKTN
jgi:small GTP-binding protein